MPYDISYEYDAAGNRTRKVDNLSAAVTTYTYDSANQLQTEQLAAVTTTYTFDRAGNMETITKPTNQVTTYVWDAENRRTAVQTPFGSEEAAYNADGLRVRNGDTRFIWDGETYLSESNSASGESVLYTVRPSRYGRLISEKRSAASDSEWFHFDALGSTVNVSTHGGGVPERYVYDAWGNLLSSNSFKPAFLYVGEVGYLSDQIDSVYVRRRYYRPSSGAFLSRDPAGDGFILAFTYAVNSPLNNVDPSGLEPLRRWLTIHYKLPKEILAGVQVMTDVIFTEFERILKDCVSRHSKRQLPDASGRVAHMADVKFVLQKADSAESCKRNARGYYEFHGPFTCCPKYLDVCVLASDPDTEFGKFHGRTEGKVTELNLNRLYADADWKGFLGAKKSKDFSTVVARAIAHEVLLHAAGEKSGHFHDTASDRKERRSTTHFVDHANPSPDPDEAQGLSDEACKLFVDKFDLDKQCPEEWP